MPLPESHSPWPPPGLAQPVQDMTGWSAWWSGDPDALSAFYGGTLASTREDSWDRSWARRGGLVGALQRFFWGQPTAAGEQRAKLHVPVAAEIAQVSADLLFAAPPSITVDDKATQAVIDELMGEDVHTQLYDAAEACSALGTTYLRVGIDVDVEPDRPLFSTVDADAAFPTFRYGRLHEVTFLSEWVESNGTYVRHLEHHTAGLVEHALYEGDAASLGQMIPLTEHSATTDLARLVEPVLDGRQGIVTQLDRLDVVHVANARSRTWRHLPAAKDLGRADISGVEGDLDALDDTWSSWMRDIRHGRSRLHVPQQYLKSLGPGKGAVADIERELYVGVNAMVDPSGSGGLQIDAQQFAIRFAEHAATAGALLERIFSGAGYSPQTFGLSADSALTAMESWNRQIRTQNTRAAKIRRWRIGVRQLATLMLAMDRVHFGGKGDPARVPNVDFQESVSESMRTRAETVQLIDAAKAASKETLVRMLHPDWDAAQVKAEVAAIAGEQPVVVSPLDAGFGNETDQPDAADDPAEDAPPAAPDDEDPAA